jgi:flagellar basal-body rod protein FlgC
MDDLKATLFIAGSGMRAQGMRIKVISENIANADSTAETPGGDPYRRKVITFANEMDRALDADVVRIEEIGEAPGAFGLEYDPAHPAADPETGYYKKPNVNTLIEMTDMREANRSYRANLQVIQTSKSMLSQTVNILR